MKKKRGLEENKNKRSRERTGMERKRKEGRRKIN